MSSFGNCFTYGTLCIYSKKCYYFIRYKSWIVLIIHTLCYYYKHSWAHISQSENLMLRTSSCGAGSCWEIAESSSFSFHLVSCCSQTEPELVGIPVLACSKQLVKQWLFFRSLCLNDRWLASLSLSSFPGAIRLIMAFQDTGSSCLGSFQCSQ